MMVKNFISAVAIFIAALIFTAQPKKAEAAIFNSLAALEASEQYALDATFSSVGFLTGFHPNGDGREKLAGSAILN